MAITDPRSKWVLAKLIDQVSTTYPLHTLFTDLGQAMKKGESVDVPTRNNVVIEQASNSSGTLAMTVQSNVPTSNRLTVDKHYGAIVEIPKMNAIFDLEGAWSDEEAKNVKIEIEDFIDQEHWDTAIGAAYNAGTTSSYWVNADGSALQKEHIGEAQAKMMNQKGVRKTDLAWVFNPWGMESVRQLPAWQLNVGQTTGAEIGFPTVGFLNGIPVVESQSVRDQRVLTGVASVIDNTAMTQVLTVASGHGIVAGMNVSTSGFSLADHNQATAVAVSDTTATTITIENMSMTTGALTDTGGTATCNLTMNGLLHRRWAFSRVQQFPGVQIVAQSGQISDELQCDTIFGTKALAGAAIMVGSPRESL